MFVCELLFEAIGPVMGVFLMTPQYSYPLHTVLHHDLVELSASASRSSIGLRNLAQYRKNGSRVLPEKNRTREVEPLVGGKS